MSRLIPYLALAALWPSLPGAGCTAHHAATMTADVSGAAGRVVILYADHGEPPRRWAPLRACDVAAGPAPVDVVRVAGCTNYIGIDYEIDVMAIEDRDGDGELDVGERYGLWAGGPLRRDREKQVGVMEIAIDKTLARGEERP